MLVFFNAGFFVFLVFLQTHQSLSLRLRQTHTHQLQQTLEELCNHKGVLGNISRILDSHTQGQECNMSRRRFF
jgi:hypothetical protein